VGKCKICGAKMVKDNIKSFTYIIPYVCPRCGYRDSKIRPKYARKWGVGKLKASKQNTAVCAECG